MACANAKNSKQNEGRLTKLHIKPLEAKHNIRDLSKENSKTSQANILELCTGSNCHCSVFLISKLNGGPSMFGLIY